MNCDFKKCKRRALKLIGQMSFAAQQLTDMVNDKCPGTGAVNIPFMDDLQEKFGLMRRDIGAREEITVIGVGNTGHGATDGKA